MRSRQDVIDCVNAEPAVATARAVAAENATRTYLVGGAIRDLFLHLRPREFDFVVEGSARAFAHAMLRRAPARAVVSGSEPETITCRSRELGRMDVMSLNGLSAVEFLARHADVTVNALAFDVRAPSIVDAYGGLGDIARQCVRGVPTTPFRTKAPHFALRAVRTALLTPAFTLDAGTRDELQACGDLVAVARPGDLGYELYAILKSPACARGIRMLAELGLLDRVLDVLLGSLAPPRRDRGERDGVVDTDALLRPFVVLDDLAAPFPALTRLVPVARHVLLLFDALGARDFPHAGDALRFVTAHGEAIEHGANTLASRFSSPGLYGFRVRMVAIAFARSLAASAAGAPIDGVLEEAVQTFGARKGLLSAALVAASWVAQPCPAGTGHERKTLAMLTLQRVAGSSPQA